MIRPILRVIRCGPGIIRGINPGIILRCRGNISCIDRLIPGASRCILGIARSIPRPPRLIPGTAPTWPGRSSSAG